ncbi:hypothetical protein NEMBOFW57_008982 [Staphylotrichum longicolle]|uniref:SET domain-containing protein n=1 Tax=Staphylotrichum longicolle TaxID=669026 RepID=A0AAD4ESP5_9PEZI|nr:hypothetical protein NEMBOFW57_008982 [Staphylotrichum longicolle]
MSSTHPYRSFHIPHDAPFKLKPSPGQGWGVFATRQIARGATILKERPLFVIRKPHPYITADDVWRAFQQLPPRQQQQFLLLRDNASSPFSDMNAAFAENSFNLATPDGLRPGPRPPAQGLFLLHSRLNHACVPNATIPTTDAGVEDVTSFATRDIAPGRRSRSQILDSTLSAETLRGQHLTIPNLEPAFASWKQGINPLYEDVKQAVDQRLEGLIENERAMKKVKAADIGFWFPDATYETLETVAFYCIWLFLWDDAIDGADLDGGVLVAEEYCQKSVAERKVLFGHLSEYMEACVTEYRWRQSGLAPSVDEFYSWRLGTSSVDVMLDLCKMLNRIDLPGDILRSNELRAMGLSVNKLLIL